MLFEIFPLWYHHISAVFVRNNVSDGFEIIFEFDNFNLLFLRHSSFSWKESRFCWSVFLKNWHLSRNWVSDQLFKNCASPSLRLVRGLVRVTIINSDHSSEIQNRYSSWNGDQDQKLMFERTGISWELVRHIIEAIVAVSRIHMKISNDERRNDIAKTHTKSVPCYCQSTCQCNFVLSWDSILRNFLISCGQ